MNLFVDSLVTASSERTAIESMWEKQAHFKVRCAMKMASAYMISTSLVTALGQPVLSGIYLKNLKQGRRRKKSLHH